MCPSLASDPNLLSEEPRFTLSPGLTFAHKSTHSLVKLYDCCSTAVAAADDHFAGVHLVDSTFQSLAHLFNFLVEPQGARRCGYSLAAGDHWHIVDDCCYWRAPGSVTVDGSLIFDGKAYVSGLLVSQHRCLRHLLPACFQRQNRTCLRACLQHTLSLQIFSW